MVILCSSGISHQNELGLDCGLVSVLSARVKPAPPTGSISPEAWATVLISLQTPESRAVNTLNGVLRRIASALFPSRHGNEALGIASFRMVFQSRHKGKCPRV